jgi:PAS domain S-box-containing protein
MLPREGKKRRSYERLPLLIAVMTVVALAIGALALHYLETRLVATTGNSLALLAAGIADKLDHTLFERYGDVQIAATTLASRMQDPAALRAHLVQMKEQYLVYRWLGIADAKGRIVAATNPATVGLDRSGAGWFRSVRDSKQVRVEDVRVSDEAGGVLAVGFAAPILGRNGEFLGVVTAQVGLSELEDVFARTVQVFQSQQGTPGKIEWQFLTHDGDVIVDSILREEGRANLRQLGLRSAQLSAADGPGYVEEMHLRRLVPVVTGYARTEGYGDFPGLHWGVIVRMDRDDILAPIRSVLGKLGLAGAVVWTPMLGLLFWMTHRLRREWATEQELRERLATILTSIGDAVIVTDTQGRVAFMNPVAQALTGWSQEDAAGQHLDRVFVIINEETRQAVESPVAKVLREGAIVGLANHTVLIARDGSERLIDDSGAPVRTEAGALAGVVLVFRDITERKQAEAALRESELRFRSVVESAADAIIVADGEGRILSWNPAAQLIFGYAKDEVLGQPLTILMPERYREAHRRGVERMRATGESRLIGKTLEAHWLRKDGREFPLECSLAMWTVGTETFFSGILRDLTERKRVERRLAAQYEITRVLAQSASLEEAGPQLLQVVCESLEWDLGAIWSVDRRANVLRCMDIWHGSSASLEEFKALTNKTVFPPGIGLPGRVWTSGAPAWIFDVTADANFPRAAVAQQERLHGAFGFPIRLGDAAVGVLEFFSHEARQLDEALLRMMDDVGIKIGQFIERTQLEEQLRHSQKLDAVGRLAGGVAHDFNNLLTVINGCSALLLRRMGSDDPLRRYPQEIQRASERAASLTQQLLAFSRRQMLEPRVLNLNNSVSAMDSMLQRLIGEHIDLVTVLGADLGLVKADPGQIEQVIMNLAVNARDAMPAGGKLTIETANVELDQAYASRHMAVKSGAYVMLALSDTGQGMDERTQARLFEPFFTTKEKGKGTGLGLSTVYGIIKQSGGTIWVYSELGRGSTFKIYLPRVVDLMEAQPLAPAPGREFAGGTETILLVEDEESVRALARETLEQAGFQVLEARHGADALMVSGQYQGPIHLLVTDVVMPEMSGRVLADRLAPRRPELKILYISGYTDNAIVHQGVLDPGTAFLPKPFSPDALVRKVREVLDAPPER